MTTAGDPSEFRAQAEAAGEISASAAANIHLRAMPRLPALCEHFEYTRRAPSSSRLRGMAISLRPRVSQEPS